MFGSVRCAPKIAECSVRFGSASWQIGLCSAFRAERSVRFGILKIRLCSAFYYRTVRFGSVLCPLKCSEVRFGSVLLEMAERSASIAQNLVRFGVLQTSRTFGSVRWLKVARFGSVRCVPKKYRGSVRFGVLLT